jgi:flagellar biosynthesis protein FliR
LSGWIYGKQIWLPQINMLTLGIQVKLVVGLVALMLWFGEP